MVGQFSLFFNKWNEPAKRFNGDSVEKEILLYYSVHKRIGEERGKRI